MTEWIPEPLVQNPALWGTVGAIVGAIFSALLVFHTYGSTVMSLLSSAFSSTSPQVEPYYEKRETKSSDWIVLRNEGDADAHNVRAKVNTGQTGQTPFASSDYDRKIPAFLEPTQATKLMAARDKDCLPPHEVTVTWEDKDGKGGERTKIVRD